MSGARTLAYLKSGNFRDKEFCLHVRDIFNAMFTKCTVEIHPSQVVLYCSQITRTHMTDTRQSLPLSSSTVPRS